MKRGHLALVGDYCTYYHCPGDCGRPHNERERSEYATLVLAAFDKQTRDRQAPLRQKQSEIRRKAKDQL